MRIGLISDTHGLLRAEIFDVFAGVDHIVHAGDVGPAELLDELASIAPVTAVWGNTDGWDVRDRIPEVARVELAGIPVVVFHGMQIGSPTPARAAAEYPGAGLVVFGHSHKAGVETVGGVTAVNPGSAGMQRFRDPVTVALAELGGGAPVVRFVELDPARR